MRMGIFQFLLNWRINHEDFEIKRDSGRWDKLITSIYKFGNGEVWAIDWYAGLTECQEDDYPYQPYPCKIIEKQVIEYDVVPIKEG